MSSRSITDLNINSITLSNSNYSGLTGYTAQSNTLTTNNSGVLLVNNVPISSGGGGSVDAIKEGIGILVVESPTGTFTIDNDGVLKVTAGDGISITNSGNGSFEINNTVNPSDFLTTVAAAATYQPIGAYLTDASLNPYSTTAQADALYQPVGAYLTDASLNPYSTTAQADTLYYPTGRIYWYIGNANLGNLSPQVTETYQINVPFYALSTSAILITVNSGTQIYSIVGQASFINSTQSPANTTLQLSFYNSSTTVTVNSGAIYTVLIIN